MEKAIVCVVGRPNVGKSTLFNRIVGKRVSITEDTPGVTRDRIYADAEWLGKYFTLIDTGGIELDSEDQITKSIKLQAQLAVDTSDVILFVVDGINGLTDADKEIANYLRKSEKKVLLTVNKIDKVSDLPNIYEFYELGLGEPFAVSGEHSLGLGDLLDEVIANFPDGLETSKDEDVIKIAFIGKPNAGKSSLVNRILGEERVIVSDIPGTTRDAIDTYFSVEDKQYMFIDTAGLRRKKNINEMIERFSVVRTLHAVDRSDVCLLVIDAQDGVTEQDTKIAGYAFEQGKAMVIAVNKWDLIEKETMTMVQYEKKIREALSFVSFAPIVFISAKTGQRVDKVFDALNKAYNNSHFRISTGVLNDIVNRAVLLNQPNSDKGKRPKLYYATQVSVAPPTFVIFAKYAEIIHFSYKRYLENQIRDYFSFEGTPIILKFNERNDKNV